MVEKITNDILESYMACRYKAYLKLQGYCGEKSDYENLMIGSRKAVRDSSIPVLQERYSDFECLEGRPISRQVLERGHSLVIECIAEDDRTSIKFDALQRVAGESCLGPFHYIPIYFHEATRVGPEQRTVLGVLACLIADLQDSQPTTGILIHGQSALWKKPRIPADAGRLRSILSELRTLQENETPPARFLNKHCQICEFRARCQEEVSARDELSLLRSLSERDIKLLGRRGIFTVTQLSYTFRPRKKDTHSNGKSLHKPALQALAIRENKVHVLGIPSLPDNETCCFLDMENDPDRGFCYLIGLIISHSETEERHSLWADNRDEEERIFDAFLAIASRQPDAPIFVYGSFEATQVRRMMQTYPGRDEIAKAVLSRIQNVLSIVNSHVYFPTFSVGLKDVMSYLGFRWTEPKASGLQSVVWRRAWEASGDQRFKSKLLTYNLEDCVALQILTRFIRHIGPRAESRPSLTSLQVDGHLITRVEEIPLESSRRDWGKAEFAIADFEFVNERAYFDYQRERVFVRTNKALKRCVARERMHKGKRRYHLNAHFEVKVLECPQCHASRLKRIPDGRLYRLILDLRFTQSGIRKHVTRVTAARYCCRECKHRFIPEEYLRADIYGRGLKSWAIYKHVGHRASFESLAEEIRDCFDYPIPTHEVWAFKPRMACLFEDTYRRLERKVTTGSVIHADETEVRLKSGRGYVWVFTNLEEVVFMYRKTREADFLRDLLKDFRGVLVSDFFSGYDSLPCAQQKCLIHLIRDFNHDVRGNPWDESLKGIASNFGRLLRKIVTTVDRYGLKTRHLAKHRRDADRFFANVASQCCSTEIAVAYQQRLLRCQAKLFTFLDYDGVAWNNNNAEHAIKKFAAYRELTVGQLTENGLQQYLTLLSISVSCKYQGLSFLKFLLSGELDLDVYRATNRRRHNFSRIELEPPGYKAYRKARRLFFDGPKPGTDVSGTGVEE